MRLPPLYNFLETGSQPPIVRAALKYYGLKECPGGADNPVIIQWAVEFRITWYVHDSTAWCSLYMGKNAQDAGYTPPGPARLLAADSWVDWGIPIPFDKIQTGDILVFDRPGGGHHVAWAVAKDEQAYHGWGGNTGDAVAIARLAAHRLMAARRPPTVEAIYPLKILPLQGVLSHNEA
jgi:uncharacterized protein (TIGR02594 family)